MIVLSLVLVIVAAVALIAGFFTPDSLTLIWVSIGACVTAMLFLGIGVLQRKRSTPATSGGYGPGAANAPVRPSGSAAPSRPAVARESPSETPSQGAEPVAARPVREEAPAAPAEPVPARPAAPTAGVEDGAEDEEPVVVPKVSARKGAVKKKVVAKKATTGEAARAVLAEVRGVGPAKQEALLQHFGSLEDLRAASPGEIAAVKGIGAATAKAIKDQLS